MPSLLAGVTFGGLAAFGAYDVRSATFMWLFILLFVKQILAVTVFRLQKIQILPMWELLFLDYLVLQWGRGVD